QALVRDLENRLASQRDEISSLKTGLDDTMRQLSKVQIDLEASARRAAASEEAKAAAEKEVERLHEQLRQAHSDNVEVKANLAREVDAHRAEKQHHARTAAEVEELKRKLEAEQKGRRDNAAELEQVKNQLKDALSQLKAKDMELQRTSAAEAQLR